MDRPDLLFDLGDSHKRLFHGILEILLFDEAYHCDDVIDIFLVGS